MIKVIAEIGCNHMGDMAIAREMIQSAAGLCGADVVKFQKRNPKECLTAEQYGQPHPVPYNAFGDTYGAHREFLEFTLDQHKELKQCCEEAGVMYSCSVWDLTSAKDICSLKPEMIKVPSATNLHFDMLEYLCSHYEGALHISTGMTTRDELERIVSFVEGKKRAKDVVLYSCTSAYPVAFEDICLLEIQRYIQQYGKRVGGIGFSGHHKGIAADIAAITLGAQWVERHFTLDRTWKGTDHAASLEPTGLRTLVRDISNVSRALTIKPKDMLDIEIAQRGKLKWEPSTYAAGKHDDS
jgi:sialic acid synthase